VIDALTQGAAVEGAQDQTPTAPETAAEPDIDDILDDPESATEEQIKAVKDRSIRKLLSRVHKLTARLKEAERATPAPGKPTQESAGQAPKKSMLLKLIFKPCALTSRVPHFPIPCWICKDREPAQNPGQPSATLEDILQKPLIIS
jgi:hypothetical protein